MVHSMRLLSLCSQVWSNTKRGCKRLFTPAQERCAPAQPTVMQTLGVCNIV